MAGFEDDLYRVEEALVAINSGTLKPESWACDRILAHGLAGQRNRLGNALDHLLAHPNEPNLRLVTILLAGELEHGKVCRGRDSVDVARDALRWWGDQHCHRCHGRGVLDIQQAQCPECLGGGTRPRPSYKPVSDAIGMINQALQRMEGQLRASLKGAHTDHLPVTGGDCTLHVGLLHGCVTPTPDIEY